MTSDYCYHIYLKDECIHNCLNEREFNYWMLQHKGVNGITYERVNGMVSTSHLDDHSY